MNVIALTLRVAVVLSAAIVIGCGTAGVKDGDMQANAPTLRDTTLYIPVQEFDKKTATYLPYVASENPYLALKGRINKQAVASFIQARRAYKAKRYDEAEKLLDKTLETESKLSGPLVMKGDIAVQQKRFDDAVGFYSKAIESNKNNINAYINLAKVMRVQGKFIEAQNVYADALAVWPDFPEAHLNLGILYDIYLNHPLRAQKHMQAYQFLAPEEDKKVSAWIKEIQGRTGVKTSLTTQ